MAEMSTLDLVSVEEAADLVGVSKRRIQQFCEQGRLGQKVGNSYVIPRKDIERFIKKPRDPGNPNFRSGNS